MSRPFYAGLIVACAALPAATSYVTPPAMSQDTLEGAWSHIATIATDSAGATRSIWTQPGLYLFVDGHYSMTRVDSDVPRPEFPEDRATAAPELLTRIWQPFTAQAGEYAVEGNRMVTQPKVAKNPGVMRPGSVNQYDVRISGDTMWLRVVANQDGVVSDALTHKMLRVGSRTPSARGLPGSGR